MARGYAGSTTEGANKAAKKPRFATDEIKKKVFMQPHPSCCSISSSVYHSGHVINSAVRQSTIVDIFGSSSVYHSGHLHQFGSSAVCLHQFIKCGDSPDRCERTYKRGRGRTLSGGRAAAVRPTRRRRASLPIPDDTYIKSICPSGGGAWPRGLPTRQV